MLISLCHGVLAAICANDRQWDEHDGHVKGLAVPRKETGLIDGEIAPYIPSQHRGWQMFRFLSGRAEEVVTQIAALSVRLHAMLVKVGLRGLR